MGHRTSGAAPVTPPSKRGGRSESLQQQLKESIERYELVAKATNDVIYDIDLVKGTVIWNDALCSNFGYEPSEQAGNIRWWTGHIHPDDALRIENEISNLAQGNHATWQSQYRFRKADGEYATIRDRAFVQRDKDGQPRRIIGSMLDITEAAKLDRAKNEFTSLVSHQLRTPLTVIQFYSTMLHDGIVGPLTPAQQEHVLRIQAASGRLIKLVGNILHISRIELDRVRLDATLTDMTLFTKEVVEELRPLAQEKQLRLSHSARPAIPPTYIDQAVFSEVLHNVLANAINYTPAGGSVQVSVAHGREGYTIRVRDTGIGIPAAARRHVFSRFYRAENAIQTGHEGTGLGLYLARLIMEVTGGSISFRANRNGGTTFAIKLPAGGMAVRKRTAAPNDRTSLFGSI